MQRNSVTETSTKRGNVDCLVAQYGESG